MPAIRHVDTHLGDTRRFNFQRQGCEASFVPPSPGVRFFRGLFSRWWQLKYFLFSPRNLGKMNPIWRAYFSKGLFNHQLVFFLSTFFVVRDTFIASFSLKSANFLATYLYKPCIRMLVDFLAAVPFFLGWVVVFLLHLEVILYLFYIPCPNWLVTKHQKTLVFSNILVKSARDLTRPGPPKGS